MELVHILYPIIGENSKKTYENLFTLRQLSVDSIERGYSVNRSPLELFIYNSYRISNLEDKTLKEILFQLDSAWIKKADIILDPLLLSKRYDIGNGKKIIKRLYDLEYKDNQKEFEEYEKFIQKAKKIVGKFNNLEDAIKEAEKIVGKKANLMNRKNANNLYIYVAGPYSAKNLLGKEENTRRALEAGFDLLNITTDGENYYINNYPYVPHITHFEDNFTENSLDWNDYVLQDKVFVERSDAIFLLPGSENSVGAMTELLSALYLEKEIII